MPETSAGFRKKLLYVLIPALLIVVYMGTTVLSSSTKKARSIVKINNFTSSCEVSNVEKHKGHVKLTLRNNSPKAMTAFVLSSNVDASTEYRFEAEFAISENDFVIAPGDQYDSAINIPSGPTDQKDINVNLLAVIFADKSSEGDQKVIQEVEDQRLGRKIQLSRALPLLDKLLSLPDTEISSYLSEAGVRDLEVALDAPRTGLLTQLKADRAYSLRHENSAELPEQLEQGLHTGKESVMRSYQELRDIANRDGLHSFHNHVLDIKHLYEKLIGRL